MLVREIPITVSDEEIKEILSGWVDLLAQGRFDDAVAMLSPEVLPANGSVNEKEYPQWTGELVEAVIRNYGLPEPYEGQDEFYKVVPVEEAFREFFEDQFYIERTPRDLFQHTYCGDAEFRLPLNYEEGNGVGDLTARFLFREISGDKMVLVLLDIHML
jgi:hypothetical protein